MSRGKPTTYRPEYAEALARHRLAGGSLSAFARSINATRMRLWLWANTHPDFRRAMNTMPQTPEPPVLIRPAPPTVVSLAAWGATRSGPTPRSAPTITEDDIDDMLWAGAAA